MNAAHEATTGSQENPLFAGSNPASPTNSLVSADRDWHGIGTEGNEGNEGDSVSVISVSSCVVRGCRPYSDLTTERG